MNKLVRNDQLGEGKQAKSSSMALQPSEARGQSLQTLTIRMPWRSKGDSASGGAPVSVIRMWISLMGQINAGLTLPILLESATTMTCFDCFSILRKTIA